MLIQTLPKGWTGNHCGPAQDFVCRWGERLQAETQVRHCGDNSLRFTADLSSIRLHGMTDVPCLLLSGEGLATAEALRDFKGRLGEAGGVPFVLAASPAAYELAQAELPNGRVLRLAPTQLEQLLTAVAPVLCLKQWLRAQIPLRRLIPYNHLLSVEGGMFFGRRNELDKLCYESDLSFAVAGPGRIGKTSLIKEYLRRLLRERDPQASRTFYIDFYHCPKDPNTVARFLAMKLEASRRGSEVTHTKLLDFLHYQRSKLGGTINLLLDEVDHVCFSEAFNVLGEAAKLEHCRLILIGKGELFRMVTSEVQLKQRLQLLQLNPLDESAARSLLLTPLDDLGFEVTEPDRLVEQVFRLTGRLPHLIQFFARKLVELAIDEGVNAITAAQVEALRWDFETAQFFISPLQSEFLEDAEVRLIAFLLLKEHTREFTPGQVRLLATRWGLPLDEMRALRICNELVIQNVLVWNKGSFQLANEALVDYARHLGILDSALESARRAINLSGSKISVRSNVR